ncbi:hypothetical protein [Phyllobacterium endophyticum]|nr:hypothetical protein [Phyllobacterium endophyticum]MBB3234533.1 hypothetical protein [Phyllobacterium endophyticum]TYR38686.1 hypothetical protein FY050_22105 [Phyllobacterium endophyticum]
MAIAKILERLDASDRANDIGNACRGRSPVIVSAEALARGISPTFQSARTGVKIARLRDIVRLPRLDGGWFL